MKIKKLIPSKDSRRSGEMLLKTAEDLSLLHSSRRNNNMVICSMWKSEHVPNEFSDVTKEISKQFDGIDS